MNIVNYKNKYLQMKKKYLLLKLKLKTGGSKMIYFGGRLIYDEEKKETIYYQDIKKKWKFYTNKEGFNLLYLCYKETQKMLDHNYKLIKQNYDNPEEEIKKGYQIYTKKNSLKKDSKSYGSGEHVTWTIEEYSHLGLQRFYLMVKSFQRFTETWALLERSKSYGLFNNIESNLNVASIGGGPGFECLAYDIFFKKYYPNIKCNFYVLDLEKNWGEYVRLMGPNYYFYEWDMYKDDLYKTANIKKLDFVIISNVLVMYMTNPDSYKFMKNLLENQTKAILINSRSKSVKAKEELEKMNVLTTNLISNNDDRQILFSLKKYNFDHQVTNIFPNVPYLK